MKRYEAYKAVQPLWNMTFPKHWEVFPLYSIAKEKSICNCTELELLSVYLDAGVVPFSKRTEKRTNATSKDVPELDTLTNILKEFHDIFGNIEWTDEDKIKKQIKILRLLV